MAFQKSLVVCSLLIVSLLAWGSALGAQAGGDLPIYLDSRQPVAERINDLLSRMTLPEKVGQLNMPVVFVDQLGKDRALKIEACKRFAEGTYTDDIGPGGWLLRTRDHHSV
jgi:beta-glucosidase